MKRLERLVHMALVLATRRRLRAAELAAQFSISERTIYRDIRALQTSGFPVEGNPGDGYRVPQSAYLRPLAFEPSEAAALALAAQLLSASADESLRERLVSALAKLESVLSSDARGHVRSQQARVYLTASARTEAGPLAEVLEAIDTQSALALVYAPVTEEPASRRDVEPLGIVRVDKAWLLVAFCRLRQDIRMFRVDRIQQLRQTGERFTSRPGFSFAEVIERERRKRARS